jgi:hypothetical protein
VWVVFTIAVGAASVIYMAAGVILRILAHSRTIVFLFDIPKKPIQSIGVLAGLLFAVPCFVIASIRWFLR